MEHHCTTVLESLNGSRSADEQTFASIGLLADKLQTVRKLHPAFMNVEFSPQVQALIEQEQILAIS